MRIFALRQCADYVRASYMWVQMGARVTFAVGYKKLFGVCSIQAAMTPLRRHPQPPSPKNAIDRPRSI